MAIPEDSHFIFINNQNVHSLYSCMSTMIKLILNKYMGQCNKVTRQCHEKGFIISIYTNESTSLLEVLLVLCIALRRKVTLQIEISGDHITYQMTWSSTSEMIKAINDGFLQF